MERNDADRRSWMANYDQQCEEIIRLTNARNHGEPNTRPFFDGLVLNLYAHLRSAPEDLDGECRFHLRQLVDEYLDGDLEAAC